MFDSFIPCEYACSMPKSSLGDVLAAYKERNESLIAVYRERSKNIPPGPIGNLAASIIEQRREAAHELAKILSSLQEPALHLAELELAPLVAVKTAGTESSVSDAAALLRFIQETEDSDFEHLSDLAGAVLPFSSELAEFFASAASAAKKRASWARDHLDLMDLSKS